MFYQIFLSPQVRRWAIEMNRLQKILWGKNEHLIEFSNLLPKYIKRKAIKKKVNK